MLKKLLAEVTLIFPRSPIIESPFSYISKVNSSTSTYLNCLNILES